LNICLHVTLVLKYTRVQGLVASAFRTKVTLFTPCSVIGLLQTLGKLFQVDPVVIITVYFK